MKTWLGLLALFATSLPIFAQDKDFLPPDLGNGDPRLFVAYNSTNEWVVFIDESLKKGWKPRDQWGSEYRHKPIKILAGQNVEPANEYPETWDTQDLFPFDEQTVFTSDGNQNNEDWPRESRVFSTNRESTLVSRNVDTMARDRYGLGTNQWFLGEIGTNIFYTETGKPNVIYFRTTRERYAVNYFKLLRLDSVIWGVKRAIDADKDVGFCVDRTTDWVQRLKWFPWAPEALPAFIELSLKDAKHRKLPKQLRVNQP